MIQYIIIDDEHMAHDIIKSYADKLPQLQLVEHCYDAIEALETLQKKQVDLIFLDINLPQLKGFEFLKVLKTKPKVIVTTAYKEYAIEGYELDIVDYLLKPFSFERFMKAIMKVLQPPQAVSKTNSTPQESTASIFVQSNKKHIQIKLDQILFIEAVGNYCKIVTQKEQFKIRAKISEFSQTLPSDQFVQVHKSFTVSKLHIHTIESKRILLEDHSIPIGNMYKLNIKSLLSDSQ